MSWFPCDLPSPKQCWWGCWPNNHCPTSLIKLGHPRTILTKDIPLKTDMYGGNFKTVIPFLQLQIFQGQNLVQGKRAHSFCPQSQCLVSFGVIVEPGVVLRLAHCILNPFFTQLRVFLFHECVGTPRVWNWPNSKSLHLANDPQNVFCLHDVKWPTQL